MAYFPSERDELLQYWKGDDGVEKEEEEQKDEGQGEKENRSPTDAVLSISFNFFFLPANAQNQVVHYCSSESDWLPDRWEEQE